MHPITNALWISDAPTVREAGGLNQFDEVVTLGYGQALGRSPPRVSTTGTSLAFPDGPHDYEAFATATDYVVEALARGDRVLVHCQAGVSRSAGVATAALATHQDLPTPEAYAAVRLARSKVDPAPAIRTSVKRYTGDPLVEQPE